MLRFSNPNAQAESRTSRPGCSTQFATWALPLVHSPRQAPKPLDAWFFEAAGVGMHLPSPSWLVASRRLNRRRKRGGLSFGCAGWARSADWGCRAAVRRRVTRRGTCCGAREWAQEWITLSLAWAHMYTHAMVKRQDNIGRSCQSTDRNITNVRV